jgi:hypothetical protein
MFELEPIFFVSFAASLGVSMFDWLEKMGRKPEADL